MWNQIRDLFPLFLEKKLILVLGCQRSGTTMLLDVMKRSRLCRVYHEADEAAYDDWRLRSPEVIRQLLKKSRPPFVVMKALNELQQSKTLLVLHDNTQAIWMVRDHRDVSDSAVKLWGDAQKKIVLWVAKEYRRDLREAENDGNKYYRMYAEEMTEETYSVVRKYAHPNMSSEEGAVLLWYMRNKIYYDLGLYRDSRILLCKYEDLVRNPESQVRNIFSFIGCPFSVEYTREIFSSSVGKKIKPSSVSPELDAVCKELMSKFDQQVSSRAATLSN